jgi:hypothetical protein
MTASSTGVVVLVQADVDGMGVAEEVVEVAEDLLVGADEERGQVVRFAVEAVQREGLLDVAAVDELIDLAVGVAGDVAEHCAARGRFGEPVDGHQREELLDRPTVGHGLEEREIAEIGIRERCFEAFEILGHDVELLGHRQNPPADDPIEVLGEGPLFEGQVAEAEEVERGIERLLGVVEALEQVLHAQVLVGLHQVDDGLFGVVAEAVGDGFAAIAGDAEDVEDQDAVVGGDGAAAFGDDVGVGDFGVVADVLDVVDDVVGVFLEAVVDAGFEVGLGAVVVDAEAAADVEEFEAGAGAFEFGVDAGGFDDRGFDVADVGDLAAEVEVEECEAVLHAGGAELFEGAEGFGDGEAELGAVAAGGFPAAGAAAGEFDAHADARADAHARGVFQDEVEFGVLFDDGRDVAADLGGEHHHLDVFVVLEAVADDGGVVVGDGGMTASSSGFEPASRPKPMLAPDLVDLFDDVALLVDLDGVDADVAALVVVLLDGGIEDGAEFAHLHAEDFEEADEDGGIDAAQHEGIDEFFQVDGALGIAVGWTRTWPSLLMEK